MSRIEDFEEELPLSMKLANGGIGFGTPFLNYIVAAAITFFYHIKLGLNPYLISLGWVIFILWNTVNDPLMGFISDKTKSNKYGRRIPYLRFGAPIYIIVFILIWIPLVPIGSEILLFLYFVLMLFSFDTVFTMLTVVGYGLPGEMAVSSKARGKLMQYGGIFNAFSHFLSFVIPIFLLTGDAQDINPYFVPSMIIIGILCGLIIFIGSFYVKENKFAQLEEPMSFVEGLKATFSNRPYILSSISAFIFWFGQVILATSVIYYLTFVLQVEGVMALIPVAIFFLMVFLFIPVYFFLMKKLGIKRSFILTLVVSGISFCSFFFLGWNYITAIIGLGILGACISGYYLMPNVVFFDVVDYDEIKTGKRRETTYAGIGALFTKPAQTVAPAVFLLIIIAFGFNQDSATQSVSAQVGIVFAFTIIPGILFFLAGIVMSFYKLDGPDWIKQKEKLRKIHDEKEANYLQHLKELNVI
ncbi:MAG: hypothetical protein GF383_03845 [Candidatus Lokiarchaeota archaeon]|nr:hypothetical protein [Candidatus Lokiarchaeota archaeon]MBD3338837.1 hypothetical protein [Candidatus Lokiarchaeota archaeon]